MGRGIEQHEVIITPEARGMRTLPSDRGESINVGRMVARREVGLKSLREIPLSRLEDAEQYVSIKAAAITSTEAARALQMLQADEPYPRTPAKDQPLQKQVEFAGIDDTEWMPPNSQIAAGREYLLTTVNSAWAIFDQTGRQLLRRNFSDMFSSLIGDANVFSPRVVYDSFKGAWILSACARRTDGKKSWFLLAVTQNENPLGDWWIWALEADVDGLNATTNWAEGLGVSVDNKSLYLTANMLSPLGKFQYAKIRILNKKDLYTGGTLHGWDFWHLRNTDGSLAFSLQPAINMIAAGIKAAGSQYLLNTTADGQGLTQWTVKHHLRVAPTLTRRFIPTVPYQIAPNAKQQMSSFEIETGDTRLGNVVFRHGQLWTAHTIAANWGEDANVAAIQWFQINPQAGRVMHQGIFGAPHYYYFAPAVGVDGEGNMLLAFNRAGDPEFPTIRFTGKLAANEAGLLTVSQQMQQSTSPGEIQWSNCSGVAISPDDSTIWIIGQYAATRKDWATWICRVTPRESMTDAMAPHDSQPAYV
ncbi:MAG: hypothetical protein IPM55_05710 [Acidobacteria bacterium]|nr:hypothetical protein [Acidobacteriota bacterium]